MNHETRESANCDNWVRIPCPAVQVDLKDLNAVVRMGKVSK